MAARNISIRVGETIVLQLTAMGATGYAWEWSATGATAAVEIRIESSVEPPTAQPGGALPETSRMQERAVLTGMAPGRASVRLMLRRPWEKDKTPLHVIDLDVEIR